MKKIFYIIVFCSLSLVLKAEYTASVSEALSEIVKITNPESTPEIGGEAVGYDGTPHQFYLIYKKVLKYGTIKEFEDMLTSHHPSVKVLGVICLSKSERLDLIEKEEEKLLEDKTEISFFPGGCSGYRTNVSKLTKLFKAHPDYLEFDYDPRK